MADILVIEDDPVLRTLVRDVLKAEGYRIREAVDGEDGVSQFLAQRADLVITDLFMPRKGGIEVITDLQELDKEVKIIAMTSHGNEENYDFLRVATALGAIHTLEKPFHLAMLRKTVASALAG